LIGAVAFKLLQDVIASFTPQYWMFWIGLFLVLFVLGGRADPSAQVPGGSECRRIALRAGWHDRHDRAAPEPRPLNKRFGGITATNHVSSFTLPARRAPCADRPERRRQDHLGQPAHRRAARPTAGRIDC
jgi:hypothetical protein